MAEQVYEEQGETGRERPGDGVEATVRWMTRREAFDAPKEGEQAVLAIEVGPWSGSAPKYAWACQVVSEVGGELRRVGLAHWPGDPEVKGWVMNHLTGVGKLRLVLVPPDPVWMDRAYLYADTREKVREVVKRVEEGMRAAAKVKGAGAWEPIGEVTSDGTILVDGKPIAAVTDFTEGPPPPPVPSAPTLRRALTTALWGEYTKVPSDETFVTEVAKAKARADEVWRGFARIREAVPEEYARRFLNEKHVLAKAIGSMAADLAAIRATLKEAHVSLEDYDGDVPLPKAVASLAAGHSVDADYVALHPALMQVWPSMTPIQQASIRDITGGNAAVKEAAAIGRDMALLTSAVGVPDGTPMAEIVQKIDTDRAAKSAENTDLYRSRERLMLAVDKLFFPDNPCRATVEQLVEEAERRRTEDAEQPERDIAWAGLHRHAQRLLFPSVDEPIPLKRLVEEAERRAKAQNVWTLPAATSEPITHAANAFLDGLVALSPDRIPSPEDVRAWLTGRASTWTGGASAIGVSSGTIDQAAECREKLRETMAVGRVDRVRSGGATAPPPLAAMLAEAAKLARFVPALRAADILRDFRITVVADGSKWVWYDGYWQPVAQMTPFGAIVTADAQALADLRTTARALVKAVYDVSVDAAHLVSELDRIRHDYQNGAGPFCLPRPVEVTGTVKLDMEAVDEELHEAARRAEETLATLTPSTMEDIRRGVDPAFMAHVAEVAKSGVVEQCRVVPLPAADAAGHTEVVSVDGGPDHVFVTDELGRIRPEDQERFAALAAGSKAELRIPLAKPAWDVVLSSELVDPCQPVPDPYTAIRLERAHQDARWGGPRPEDPITVAEFCSWIHEHATKAEKARSSDELRHRLVQVAALAVATIEACDRGCSRVYEQTREGGGDGAYRSDLNAFAKSVLSAAKECGVISNETLHDLAGVIDRALWPERYSPFPDPTAVERAAAIVRERLGSTKDWDAILRAAVVRYLNAAQVGADTFGAVPEHIGRADLVKLLDELAAKETASAEDLAKVEAVAAEGKLRRAAFHEAVATLVRSAIERHGANFDSGLAALANATEGPLVAEREALVQRALESIRIGISVSSTTVEEVESGLKLLDGHRLIDTWEGQTVIDPAAALARVKLGDFAQERLSDLRVKSYEGWLSPVDQATRDALKSIFSADLWGVANFTPEEAVLRHLSKLVERAVHTERTDGARIDLVDFVPTVRVVVEVARRAVNAAILKLHGVDAPARVDDLPRPAEGKAITPWAPPAIPQPVTGPLPDSAPPANDGAAPAA